jgi:GMP synthase-like glutamine amidotransferase/DNA-binding CsgD family transcriptional regulator
VRALALEHIRLDQVGVFGDVLRERGVACDVVMLDQGDAVPDWRGYDLIVCMGGPQSAYDESHHPWLAEEKAMIGEAARAGVPFFGICLGAQLLAAALGAEVFRGPEPELGLNPMFLTDDARRDPVYRAFPDDVEVFEWHQDHFDLPEGSVRLARSPRYPNQAFRWGSVAYGLQPHLEPSLDDVRAWFAADPAVGNALETRYGAGALDAFLEEYGATVPFLQETARQLLRRWLEVAAALGAPATGPAAVPIDARPSEPGDGLVGRDEELAEIDRLLSRARAGESGVLVVRGDPGSGKTTLLEEAVRRAAGMRVLRSAGVESASETPFRALAELLRPLAPLLDRVAPRQAEALAAVLGTDAGPRSGDRFAVYAAALRLLGAAAEDGPLIVAVDDAHRLDPATLEALSFVGDRLAGEGIAVVVAAEGAERLVPARAELWLGPLGGQAARTLLARTHPELAGEAVEAIVVAAGGNPLALLEIPASLAPEELRGGAVHDAVRACATAEQAFLRRIEALPSPAARALLVAALSERDDRAVVAAALAELGLGEDALAGPERAGLVAQSGDRVRFRHPLVRTAGVYSALRTERRAAHAALATALDSADPDLAAWHRARAAAGPDEAVAARLAAVAERARARRAYASASRGFELAARLSPGTPERAERLLAAAETAELAGHAHAALDHLDAARAAAPEAAHEIDAQRGRVLARAGDADAARAALEAAAAGSDGARAASLLAEAVIPSLRAGDPRGAVEVGRRSLACAERLDPATAVLPRVMLGTALLLSGAYAEGRAHVQAAYGQQAALEPRVRAYLGGALRLAGDVEAARAVLGALVDEARADGAAGLLSYPLVRLADAELEAGRWAVAEAQLEEAATLAAETGLAADLGLALGGLAWLDAARGREASCRERAGRALAVAERLGSGSRLDRARAALGLLELGLGRAGEAAEHLELVLAQMEEQGWSDAGVTPHRLPELVEAYAEAGDPEAARAALAAFEQMAVVSGRASALAALARSRALLAGPAEALAVLDEAVGHEAAGGPFEQARTRLVRARALAASGRNGEAQHELEQALDVFEALGADVWAARAREALAELDCPARAPRPPKPSLGPVELQVALAVAGGASVDQAADGLMLTPQTVAHHLAVALERLAARSPAELRDRLAASGLA